MEYKLKNGKTVNIRRTEISDAEAMISIITQTDRETLFLARNPGEFDVTAEKERGIIESVLNDPDSEWFIAEYEGKAVGQCGVNLVSRRQRYRHRAEAAFRILKDYCGIGIGGKMMEECLSWCREKGVRQVELDVVAGNEAALKMYRGFGFEITGTVPRALCYPDGTYADEYKMVKFLDV